MLPSGERAARRGGTRVARHTRRLPRREQAEKTERPSCPCRLSNRVLMNEQETEKLHIDKDLYARLRSHCDREHLRFLDFVESCLEDALAGEPAAKTLEAEIERLREKADDHDRAFNRGFRQGFEFLYLMLKGLRLSRAAEEGLGIVRRFPAEAPKGEQMRMF